MNASCQCWRRLITYPRYNRLLFKCQKSSIQSPSLCTKLFCSALEHSACRCGYSKCSGRTPAGWSRRAVKCSEAFIYLEYKPAESFLTTGAMLAILITQLFIVDKLRDVSVNGGKIRQIAESPAQKMLTKIVRCRAELINHLATEARIKGYFG